MGDVLKVHENVFVCEGPQFVVEKTEFAKVTVWLAKDLAKDFNTSPLSKIKATFAKDSRK